MSNHRRRFNDIKALFNQNPTASHYQAIRQFYELKNELEQLASTGQATFESDMVLFSVYQVLGFHGLACAIYLKHHDVNDKAHLSKIYKLTQKAKSHGNHFILKDVQSCQNQLIAPQSICLTLDDFVPMCDDDCQTNHEETFFINQDIAIFGRYFASNDQKIEVILPKNSLQIHLPKLQSLINYFVLMDKKTLIDYYNHPPNHHCFTVQATHQRATDDWFYTLELYSFQVSVYGGDNPSFYVNISVGDDYDVNHILQMAFDGTKLYRISYG